MHREQTALPETSWFIILSWSSFLLSSCEAANHRLLTLGRALLSAADTEQRNKRVGLNPSPAQFAASQKQGGCSFKLLQRRMKRLRH